MLAAVAVGLGGAVGALARYGADRFLEHHVAGTFPWSTLLINVSGCFLAGLAVAAVVDRHHAPSWLGLGIVTGFLGAYTTFSTFAQETYELHTYHLGVMLANITVSVAVGLAAVAAGNAVGRHL
jgi:CrcB protein